MARKIRVSDVWKKHLKIIGYLALSAALAYGLSLIVDKPEAVYFAPVINYVIYVLQLELKKEGFVKAMK